MYLLLDIGATNTRIAYTENRDGIAGYKSFKTVPDFNLQKEKVQEICSRLVRDTKPKKIIIAIPGHVHNDGTYTGSPNLRKWEGNSLYDLCGIANVPTQFVNDADAAGLGEALYGAGKDREIVAYLTISTGVGGARVVHGRIDEHAREQEPGWSLVYGYGAKSAENHEYDALELFVSGSALEARFGEKAESIDDPSVWESVIKVLAIGVYNTIRFWSPEILILGGSVMEKIDIRELQRAVKDIQAHLREVPEIKVAALGDMSGLYGAYALART